MMIHKQDFRVQKIFQKREQIAGILVPPVLAVLNTCIKTLEK